MKRIITLTAEQEKVYKQMKEMALAQLNGKLLTTANALSQLMRLHQITCGHFKANDGSTQAIKNNRLTELMGVLEEIEGKAVIWAHYQFWFCGCRTGYGCGGSLYRQQSGSTGVNKNNST